MTGTIFIVPETKRSALSCVWIETGNLTQPLVSVWIDRDLCTIICDGEQEEPEMHQLCA